MRGPSQGVGSRLMSDAREDDEDPRADLRFGTVPRLVAEAAALYPGDEALVEGETRLTFPELAARVTTFSRALIGSGVAAGDRVAIWAPNCAEWVVGALGVLGAGGVLVTVNTRFKGAEAAHVLQTAEVRTVLTVRGFLGIDYPSLLADQDLPGVSEVVLLRSEDTAETDAARTGGEETPVIELSAFLARAAAVAPAAAAERAAAVRPEDPADLIFTSGTTGHPKGALSTHLQDLRTFGAWASIVGLRRGDRYLVVNPFFHTFGFKAGLLASLMTGATVLPAAAFEAARMLEVIASERVSVLPGPPTLYESLLAHPQRHRSDLSSLRLGVTGAASVPVELVIALREELGFDTVLTGYGLTEACGTVTMCRRGDPPEVIATTAGRALPGLAVKVVGEDGSELRRGDPGEVVVRGYTVMEGYWGDPQATEAAIDREGWLHTGDIGVMDAVGNLRITDRLKDMFVVGGFNAYPAEIETMLRGCPGVDQVAVIGVPDTRLGEVACAYVVPEVGDHDAEQVGSVVFAWARESMANYKAPRYVGVIGSLPLNASGKVLKRELRERFERRADRIVTPEGST